MRHFYGLILIMICGLLPAQIYEWSRIIGSAQSGNSAGAIASDKRGNTLVLGVLNDDMLISKTDSSGNTSWSINIPGTPGNIEPWDICTDKAGNVYATGKFSGNLDFDPGSSTYTMTAKGPEDAFVLKLDSAGNFIWAKGLGGSGTVTGGFGIAVNPNNGHVISTGYAFGDSTDFDPDASSSFYLPVFGNDDSYISELDASGNFVNALFFGRMGQERSNDIAIDKDGNVYTIGNFHGNVDFDPGPAWNLIAAVGLADAYISKLDSSFNHVWTATISGSNEQQGHAIEVDDSGNVYSVGLFEGSTDFDPGSGSFNLNTGGAKNMFMSKLNANGSLAWARQFEVPVVFSTIPVPGWSVAVDNAGGVFTTGRFKGTVDFDPGSGQKSLSTAYANHFETFILRLSSAGHLHWVRRLENSAPGDNEGVGVAVSPSGAVHTTGTLQSTVDFDPSSATSLNSNLSATPDIYIQRMRPCGIATALLTRAVCDSLVSPSGTYTWYTSGTFRDTLTTLYGCDSVITINLSVDTLEADIINNDPLLSAVPSNADAYQWLNCDSSFTVINGATGASYSPLQNGNYAVVITRGGCIDTSECSPVQNIGMERNILLTDNFTLYPNPAKRSVNIAFSSTEPAEALLIRDLSGRIILTKDLSNLNVDEVEADLRTFNSGVYLVEVKWPSGSDYRKLNISR